MTDTPTPPFDGDVRAYATALLLEAGPDADKLFASLMEIAPDKLVVPRDQQPEVLELLRTARVTVTWDDQKPQPLGWMVVHEVDEELETWGMVVDVDPSVAGSLLAYATMKDAEKPRLAVLYPADVAPPAAPDAPREMTAAEGYDDPKCHCHLYGGCR